MKDLQPINFPGLDPRRPLVIAGPCSAETEEQVIETARELAAEGVRIFRAGLWKPRTKPGGFEGVGAEGVAWLRRVKRETGMYTATEVATRKHVMAALEGGIDMIWIGARTTATPFAMQEIADALKQSCGIELDRRKLVLDEPIKTTGIYTVRCKLGYEITADLRVEIKEQ